MAGLIYTEDRETFERQMMRPPHAARLMEHAGRFVGRLDNADKDALLQAALDEFWETREQIKETQDILRLWVKALEFRGAAPASLALLVFRVRLVGQGKSVGEAAMNGWDDYMDALGELPEWMQYRNRLRVAAMVKTAEQLAKYGVPYPHAAPRDEVDA